MPAAVVCVHVPEARGLENNPALPGREEFLRERFVLLELGPEQLGDGCL